MPGGFTVIVESFWFRPRDLGFAEAGVRSSRALRAIELWCDLPGNIARQRYARRVRHPVYEDDKRLQRDWATWELDAVPLEICPTIRVDTSRPVDIAPLTRLIREVIYSA